MLVTLVRMIRFKILELDKFSVRSDVKTGTESLPPEGACWYLMGSSHHFIAIVPGTNDANFPVIFSELFSTLAFILKDIYEHTAQRKAQ